VFLLLELVEEKYVTLTTYNSYTIYEPNKIKIHDAIKKNGNHPIVNEILIITKETYLTTSIFYNVIFFCLSSNICNGYDISIMYIIVCLFQLPTTIHAVKSAKYEPVIDKTIMYQKYQKKVTFIKNFLNSILQAHFNNINIHTIYDRYIQKTDEYKHDLKKLLQTLSNDKTDSSLTVDELLYYIEMNKNSRIDIVPQTSTSQPLQTELNSSKLQFYPESEIQKYLYIHYP